jgi:hypothetical protein
VSCKTQFLGFFSKQAVAKKKACLNFGISMRKFYVCFLLLFFLGGHAQGYHKKKYKKPLGPLDNKWAWSANASVFAFKGINSHTSAGFDAEWFFTESWSLRGGLSAGTNYIKLTTEPFTLRLLASDWGSRSSYRSHNISWRGAQVLFLLLLNSDALCYNIPISKGLYLSLIASPLQTIVTIPNGRLHLYSLMGGGLKYISRSGFTLNSTFEYDKSFLFRTSDQGVKLNFSVGYLFR